jgi:hypothetical protein
MRCRVLCRESLGAFAVRLSYAGFSAEVELQGHRKPLLTVRNVFYGDGLKQRVGWVPRRACVGIVKREK